MIQLQKIIPDLLFPRRCAVCDDISDIRGQGVCSKCLPKIVYIKEPCCMKCGKQLARQEQEYCRDCSRNKHFFIKGTALYDQGSMAEPVFRYKYGNRPEYARFYGRDLYEKKRGFLEQVKPDALVPVPIHWSRMRRRGYNQAQLIARELSKYSGIPVREKLIRRCVKTAPLKDLGPLERQNNLKKAFKICQNDVKLKTIVIIDDIYTTGSTIDAMAKAFYQSGVESVYFMTLTIG